jgi:uncharacterized protein YfiM (DUF2279 family)
MFSNSNRAGIMRKLITFIFLTLSLVSFSQDRWVAKDKAMHVGVSAIGTYSLTYVFTNMDYMPYPKENAMVYMFSIGLVKEFFIDGKPSYKDITANAVGCVTGYYLNKWIVKMRHKHKMHK